MDSLSEEMSSESKKTDTSFEPIQDVDLFSPAETITQIANTNRGNTNDIDMTEQLADVETLKKRAQRFQLQGSEDRSRSAQVVKTESKNESFDALYEQFKIDVHDENSIFELNAIHMRGVDSLTPTEIFSFFAGFSPKYLEILNTEKCNVLFENNDSAARAMVALSSELDRIEGMEDESLETKKPSVEDGEICVEVSAIVKLDNNRVRIDTTKLEIPEGIWRVGKPYAKTKLLLLKFATKEDRAPEESRELIEPDAGLLKNRKRKQSDNQKPHRADADDDLRRRLEINRTTDDRDQIDYDKKQSGKNDMDTASDISNSNANSDSEPDSLDEILPKTKKQKLRMRMRADDEEIRKKKRKPAPPVSTRMRSDQNFSEDDLYDEGYTGIAREYRGGGSRARALGGRLGPRLGRAPVAQPEFSSDDGLGYEDLDRPDLSFESGIVDLRMQLEDHRRRSGANAWQDRYYNRQDRRDPSPGVKAERMREMVHDQNFTVTIANDEFDRQDRESGKRSSRVPRRTSREYSPEPRNRRSDDSRHSRPWHTKEMDVKSRLGSTVVKSRDEGFRSKRSTFIQKSEPSPLKPKAPVKMDTTLRIKTSNSTYVAKRKQESSSSSSSGSSDGSGSSADSDSDSTSSGNAQRKTNKSVKKLPIKKRLVPPKLKQGLKARLG